MVSSLFVYMCHRRLTVADVFIVCCLVTFLKQVWTVTLLWRQPSGSHCFANESVAGKFILLSAHFHFQDVGNSVVIFSRHLSSGLHAGLAVAIHSKCLNKQMQIYSSWTMLFMERHAWPRGLHWIWKYLFSDMQSCAFLFLKVTLLPNVVHHVPMKSLDTVWAWMTSLLLSSLRCSYVPIHNSSSVFGMWPVKRLTSADCEMNFTLKRSQAYRFFLLILIPVVTLATVWLLAKI